MITINTSDYWKYLEDHPMFTGCLVSDDGTKMWFQDGRRHREDGAAVENASGSVEYYLNNKYFLEPKYKIAVRKMKLKRRLKRIKEQLRNLKRV